MVNHVRTLLLNLPAVPREVFGPGEEYVPPDFTPIYLSGPIAKLRTHWFGSDPDRMTANFVAHSCLTLLEASRCRDVMSSFDKRVTFNVGDIDLTQTDFKPTVNRDGGQVNFLGQILPQRRTGRNRFEWRIDFSAGRYTADCLTGQDIDRSGAMLFEDNVARITLSKPTDKPEYQFALLVSAAAVTSQPMLVSAQVKPPTDQIFDSSDKNHPIHSTVEEFFNIQFRGDRDLESLWRHGDSLNSNAAVLCAVVSYIDTLRIESGR